MKTTFSIRAIVALVALFAAGAATAQQAQDVMEVIRGQIETNRKLLVAENMALEAAESEVFWPLYDEYRFDAKKLGDERARIINEFADNYDTLTDEQAKKLTKDALKNQRDKISLKQKYARRFEKELGAVKTLRYLQIEGKLDSIIDYDIARAIPLAPAQAAAPAE